MVISKKGVMDVASKMKCRKTSGVDGVKAEHLKSSGYKCVECMIRFMNVCSSSEGRGRSGLLDVILLYTRGMETNLIRIIDV